MKRFTTILSVLALTLLLASSAFAQNVIDYSFTNTTAAYAELGALGDSVVMATGSQYDDGLSGVLPIGFTFRYAGTNFTQFRMNTNGWMTFDVSATSTTNYAAVSGTVPDVIAAFGKDMDSVAVGGFPEYRVYTSGSVGSRITKIQWKNLGFFTGSGYFRFQIWLYETSNKVEIHYGASAFPTSASTVQVGLRGGNTSFSTNTLALYGQATGPFNWTAPRVGVNGATTMDVTLAVPPAGSVAAIPDSGRVYTFTPPTAGSPLSAFAAYTIDNSLPTGGGNYASFAEAFAALNTNGVSGPTTFTVGGAGAVVSYNEANLTLGGVLPSGANTALLSTLSATNTLTFVAAGGKTINLQGQGTSSSDFAIRLAGVNHVTFDGINVVDTVVSAADSANRRLEFGYVLCNASNERGATDNTIKNFTINLQKTPPTITVYGVVVTNGTATLSTTTGVAGAYASRANNNKIQNFFITNVKRGIQFDGLPYPAYNEGNEASGPAFTSAAGGVWTGGSRVTNYGTSTTGTDMGIGIDGEKGLKVFNVQIDNGYELTSTPALSGIHFGISASGSDGCNEVEIYNCVVHNLDNSAALNTTNSANGIRCSGTTFPHTVKIYNTAIYDLRNTLATGANAVVGMQLTSNVTAGGNKFELYNNSINIASSWAAAGTAKGIGIDGNLSNIYIAKNNIISVTGGGTGGAIGVNGSAATGSFITFANNLYDVGTTGATRRVGLYPATARITLTDWQSALASATVFSDGLDQRSGYGAAGFVGATDITYGASNRVNNSGVAISGLSTPNDILGNPRGANPDLGVFEGDFSAGFVDAASPGISIAPLEGSIAAEIRVLVTDNRQGGANTDSLKARLWYRGTPFTGAFSPLAPDVAPLDSGNGEYRWGVSLRALAAGTYQYYIVVRDSAGNSFADPTMVAGGVAPGFSVSPADAGYLGTNPFASAGVRTFQNAGSVLAAGTYSVGPTGTYPSLTAVAAEVNTKPLAGNVIFELQPTYAGAGEAYPIVFNQPSYTVAGPITITIRPDVTVASPLVTSGVPSLAGSQGTPLIVLDGMRDLTIDGRPGGVGVTSMWSIRNAKDSAATNNCGPTIALINDASRNTLKYLQIQGNASVSTTGALWGGYGINAGVVSIGGTYYGGKGNNNNTVDHCEVMNYAAGAIAVPPNPLRGIISFGAVNSYNGGNTFSNNNIHDYFSPATTSATGILLQQDGGSTITGNSFYQTAARTTLVSLNGIVCSATTAPGWTITNNFIGGSAPGATGGPLVDSVLAAGTGGLTGMNISTVLNTSATTISGNVFKNIFFKSASTTAVVAQLNGMILAANQYPFIIQDNIIGDNTVDASASPSILIQTTASVTHTYFGIFAGNGGGTGGLLTIRRNIVGGIRVNTFGTAGGSVTGILDQFTGAPLVCDSNIVGSATVANSIYQTSNAPVTGVLINAGVGLTSFNGNLVANVNILSAASATASTFTGLNLGTSGTYSMLNNTVRNISSNSNSTSSHLGIIVTTAGLNNLIRGNTVSDFNFSPFTPATAINIFGMAIVNVASTGRIEKNRVYNIVNAATSTSAGIFGIANQGGLSWTYSNNMVSLGAGSTGDINIQGMQERSGGAAPGEISYVYNSVWISGAVPTGALPSYAFIRTGTVNGAIMSVHNNVFQNDRSGTPGFARGFAIGNTDATGANGWLSTSSDRNMLKGNTDSVAQWVGSVNKTLAGWQAAQPGGSGGDANSKVGDAQFTGTADLHVNTAAVTASTAGNLGTPIALNGTDFDGDTRNASTPDAGYDEFTLPSPAAFALTTPASGATGQPLSVTLNWGASAQVASYDLYIGVGSVPGTPTVTGITGTSYVFAASPSSTYFWNVKATNADAQTVSSNGPFNFTTISPPAAPSGLSATPTGPVAPDSPEFHRYEDQLRSGVFSSKEEYQAVLGRVSELKLVNNVNGMNLSWTDNAASGSNTEDSFYVYKKLNSAPAVGGHASPDFLAAVDSVAGSGGLGAYVDGPLGINEHWYYKVTAKNAQGESGSSAADATTFVNTPNAPTFSDVHWNRMKIYLDINGNPGTTETYAIYETSTAKYLTAAGTLTSATEVWQTYTAWGGVSGKQVSGLSRGTAYSFEVKARNGANVETPFGATGIQGTTWDQPSTSLNEDFTSVAFPPPGWTLLDEPTVRWTRQNGTEVQPNGLVGPKAMFNFFSASVGEMDTLITPTLNLAGAISVALNWSHSYRTYTSLDPDSVFVMISSDNGSTWSTLQADGYPNMATRTPNTSSAGPASAADWRANVVDIPAMYFTSTVKIGWMAKSAFGNNYWLDDISVIKKSLPNTITVRSQRDLDGDFATSGDRVSKSWHLSLNADSLGGTLVASGDADSIMAINLLDGTYIATEADSASWFHIGKVHNGTPAASTAKYDTIVVIGGGIAWVTDFVNTNVPNDIRITGDAGASRPGGPALGASKVRLKGGVVSTLSGTPHHQIYSVTGNPNFEVIVSNVGQPQPSYQVGYLVDGIAQTPVSNTDPLSVGDADTLGITWTSPSVGVHTFRAYTILATDLNAANDSSATITFEVLPASVVFHQGFNAYAFPPSGWTALNQDGNTGGLTTWTRDFGWPGQEGTAVTADAYTSANGFLIDDWLITPNTGGLLRTNVTNADSVSFVLQDGDPLLTYPDTVEVLVSTIDATPANFTLVDVIQVPGSLQEFKYALPNAANRYVAFRYHHFDGGPLGSGSNYFMMDDVRITRSELPSISVAPATVNFGNVVKNECGSDTVVVKNPGSVTLTVDSARAYGGEFGVTPGGVQVIAPGDSVKYAVSFCPTASGAQAGTVVFYSNADTTPDSATVSGTGVQSGFSASVDTLHIGQATVPGFGSTDSVTITNTGGSDLLITLVTISGGEFTFGPAGAATIPAAGTKKYGVTFNPTSIGYQSAVLEFTSNAKTSTDTVIVDGTGVLSPKFLTVVPDTIIAKDPIKGKLLKSVKRVKPGKPILAGPNWANLMDETTAQGGFQPGASEGDSAGGMVIGHSFMFKKNPGDPLNPKWTAMKIKFDTAWVRLTKWDFKKTIGKNYSDMQKTLEDKVGKHDNYTRGLDSTLNPGDAKRKFLKGQLTKLLPGKGKNRMFAELVALKLNIAASQLGKTPAGFGDLLYDDNGTSPYNDMTIMDISKLADTMMTYWKGFTQTNFDTLYNTVYRVNRAFVGVLDTATFYQGGLLSLKGSKALSLVPFLKQGARPATRLGLTTLETESPEDFEDSEWDNAEDGTPLAAKLYQNYPNPFNPTTNIAFRLLEPSLVTVKVYNLLGQEVATLLNNEEMTDEYVTVSFDARNLASGVYFYKVDVRNSETGVVAPLSIQKMMLLK